jgi:hypothetical protein
MAIMFTKLLPKLTLVFTGQIPVFDCYVLFGWKSDSVVEINKNILDEAKSYTMDYAVLINGFQKPKQFIGKYIDKSYLQDKITKIINICSSLDNTDILDIDVNTIYDSSVLFMNILQEYLLNLSNKQIQISKLYEIYSELSDIMIYQQLVDKKFLELSNIELLGKNVYADIIEQIVNKVLLFGICSEINSVFGVNGLHFINTYIADFLIAKEYIETLVSLPKNEIYEGVAAIV